MRNLVFIRFFIYFYFLALNLMFLKLSPTKKFIIPFCLFFQNMDFAHEESGDYFEKITKKNRFFIQHRQKSCINQFDAIVISICEIAGY